MVSGYEALLQKLEARSVISNKLEEEISSLQVETSEAKCEGY